MHKLFIIGLGTAVLFTTPTVYAEAVKTDAAPPEHEHTHADEGHDHAAHTPSAKALKEQAIATAVRTNDMAAARLLLHDWLRLGGEPETMVFMGLILRHPGFTRLLIAEGANPNATAQGMYKDVPALQVSLLEGEPLLALALIKSGADVYQRDPKGNTALMVAAVSGQHDVVKALLAHKANVRATNAEGHTALQLMTKNLERARLSAQMYTQYQRIISLLDEAELHLQKGLSHE